MKPKAEISRAYQDYSIVKKWLDSKTGGVNGRERALTRVLPCVWLTVVMAFWAQANGWLVSWWLAYESKLNRVMVAQRRDFMPRDSRLTHTVLTLRPNDEEALVALLILDGDWGVKIVKSRRVAGAQIPVWQTGNPASGQYQYHAAKPSLRQFLCLRLGRWCWAR